MKALMYASIYSFQAFLAVYDWAYGVKRWQPSEHDRFADRAMYSRRRSLDPLA